MDKSEAQTMMGTGSLMFQGDYSQFQAAFNNQSMHPTMSDRHGNNYSWNGVMEFLKD
jgi:Na+-transporting NADH:ubiquinone oxidoreductase subunit NqrF